MADVLQSRQYTIQILFILTGIILLFKAFQLQIWDSSYREKANATAIDRVTQYPSRGSIYDRNNRLLVNNNPVYDVMVTYRRINPEMDTAKFCRLAGIDKESFKKRLNKDWRSNRYSKYLPFVFLKNISAATYARFQESMYEFPGFYVRVRNVRGYPYKNAAHVLGYIREVNQREIESSKVYSLGDYIGASGLELAYEEELRGIKGVKYILKDNLGRDVGPYKDGSLDSVATSGHDLISSLDIELQAYGEQLMQNKIGSIVAIEPSSGEILAMISSPTYDPNLLTINRNRGAAYSSLAKDSNKPLFDRSVMAQYPPGSLFKTIVALIGMQEGVLKANKVIPCAGAYFHNGQRLTGCHGHPTCSSIAMGIQHSCNAYFVTAFRDIVDMYGFYNPNKGLDTFNVYLDKFGMGRPLEIDFPREGRGNFPTSEYYTKHYKEDRWNSIWIRSVGIGQGELLATNLQLANMAAIIANRGHYYIPHLAKGFKDQEVDIPQRFKTKQEVDIKREHFELVVDGMEQVVLAGTARRAIINDVAICGKTGTAENPHGEDHSIFFAFAPKDNPKIALAVYIENGGGGGTYAAPTASLMIEKYLKREIHPNRKYREQRILETNLIPIP